MRMSTKKPNMIYALKNNELVHVSEVPSGLKCESFCPACNEKLVSKKGKKVIHHFAHYNSEECKYGYETSLHLAAKQMIAEVRKITIPAVYLNFPSSGKERLLISEAKEIEISEVFLEQREGNIIPDIVILSNYKKIFIEIYVTHAIDESKLLKVKNNDISTIEIDLSDYNRSITKEELEKVILKDSEKKKWIYNSYENSLLKKFVSVSKPMPIVSRGYALHVDYCSMRKRSWKGKPYANVIDDCNGCSFCISLRENEIFCSAEACIANVDDFHKTIEERKTFYHNQLEDERYECYSKRICPNCGSNLVERMGKFGEFIGCSQYPHCRFTVNIDKETGEIIMRA